MRYALAILALLLLVSCAKAPTAVDTGVRPDSCAHDSMICPDGSIIERTGANCAFVCPEKKDDGFCDYGSPKRDYLYQNPRQCEAAKSQCDPPSQPFSDHCGCGCTVDYTPPNLKGSKVTNN